MQEPKKEKGKITVSLPIDVHFESLPCDLSNGPTAILFHGYRETGLSLLETLGPSLKPLCKKIISLNGPFPVPKLGKNGFEEAYAWFFRSSRQGITIISPSVCEVLFQKLRSKCISSDDKIVAIGFSQGGYVLPYFSNVVPETSLLIGFSTSYILEDYRTCKTPVVGVHAEDDEMIDCDESEKQFLENWPQEASSFMRLRGGHSIDSLKKEALIQIIEKRLGESAKNLE